MVMIGESKLFSLNQLKLRYGTLVLSDDQRKQVGAHWL